MIMKFAQLIFVLATCVVAIRGDCTVSTNQDFPSPQPLVLNPGLNEGFRYPVDNSGTLRFSAGEQVRLVCPGSSNRFKNLPNSQRDVTATCVSGSNFKVSGLTLKFDRFSCTSAPYHTERRSGRTCLGGRTEVEVGFNIGTEFLTLLIACHDESVSQTIYTKFNLVKEIGGYQKGFPRPRWNQGGNFWSDYDMDTQYKRKTQQKTIGTVLGSTSLGQKYIHSSDDFFFSRGHNTAKADFVYGAQQTTTFYYVNTSPQWQVFNGGNWNDLENDVRGYASATRQDLTVYTGVHGVAQLPNSKGVLTDLYFFADSAGRREMPIPKFFWKVIYNEETQLGTAFVGVNNPYLTKITDDYYLCDDISSKIRWLTWRPDTVTRGISYSCTVDSLRKVVPNIPSFTVKGILT